MRSVLVETKEKGIKSNEDKLEVGLTEVPYFGHIISALNPTPLRSVLSRTCSPHKIRQNLKPFLVWLIICLSLPQTYQKLLVQLRKLLVKDVHFAWDQPLEQSFQKVKDVISQSPGPVLSYCDHKKELTLQVDASKFGLGATLLQDCKPIAFASKSLTPTEVN